MLTEQELFLVQTLSGLVTALMRNLLGYVSSRGRLPDPTGCLTFHHTPDITELRMQCREPDVIERIALRRRLRRCAGESHLLPRLVYGSQTVPGLGQRKTGVVHRRQSLFRPTNTDWSCHVAGASSGDFSTC